MKKAIGFYRWEAGVGIAGLVLAAIVVLALVPVANRQIDLALSHVKQYQFLGNASSLHDDVTREKNRSAVLDSLLTVFSGRGKFDETEVLTELYVGADSAGCSLSKVEIGEAVLLDHGTEYPVQVEGTGRYASIGAMLATIENMNRATRVRSLSLKSDRQVTGEAAVDFVVMEKRRP